MNKALTLIVLIITTAMAVAQGTVVLENQTGLVRQWTAFTDSTLIAVPKSNGSVQLFAAPKGTALPNPLFDGTMHYSSLAGFLAANPGWAGAINASGAVPVLVALGAGLFNGGTFTIANINEAANAEYFLLGWTGPYTSADAAIAAWNAGLNMFSESPIATTATGDPLASPPGTAVSLKTTFAGLAGPLIALRPIPEPTTFALAGLGAAALMILRGRR